MAKHRELLRGTVRGLSDDQAATRSTVSALCLGGIIKHVARTERRWRRFIEEGPAAFGAMDASAYAEHAESFRFDAGDRLQVALDDLDAAARETEELVRSLPSMDADQPLPEAPWFEQGARWSVRRVLVHVIAETAQHAGHADIVREAIDGQRSMG